MNGVTLEQISFQRGLTFIGDWAFNNFSLSAAEFSSERTSRPMKLGAWAFSGNVFTTSITIPDGVTVNRRQSVAGMLDVEGNSFAGEVEIDWRKCV